MKSLLKARLLLSFSTFTACRSQVCVMRPHSEGCCCMVGSCLKKRTRQHIQKQRSQSALQIPGGPWGGVTAASFTDVFMKGHEITAQSTPVALFFYLHCLPVSSLCDASALWRLLLHGRKLLEEKDKAAHPETKKPERSADPSITRGQPR